MDPNPEQMHNSTVKAPVDITRQAPVQEWHGSAQGVIRAVDYQTQLSAAMLDIKSLQNPVSEDSSQLSDIMPEACLEGPFGLGPLVFPSLQRFNNINFFMVSYCILSLAQGKLEDQDCSGKWNCEVDLRLTWRERRGYTTCGLFPRCEWNKS